MFFNWPKPTPTLMAFTSKHCCGWTILGNFWKTLGYISRSNEWQMGWTSNLKILTRLVWRDGETARVLTICNNVRYWGNVFAPEIEKRLFRFEIESHFSISNLRKEKGRNVGRRTIWRNLTFANSGCYFIEMQSRLKRTELS